MPLSIAQSKTIHRYGDTPLPSFQASGYAGIPVWLAPGGGTFTNPEGALTDYVPLNRTALLNVTLGDLTQITYQNKVNVTEGANRALSKTGGAQGAYDAGASSVQQIAGGDFAARVRVQQGGDVNWFFGLTPAPDPGAGYTEMRYSVQVGFQYQVFEQGFPQYTLPGQFVQAGDVLEIVAQGGVVQYRLNGTAFYTSSLPPVYPLVWDCCINRCVGVALDDARLTSAAASALLQIYGTVPIMLSWSYEHEEDEQATVSPAEDKRYRKVAYSGPAMQKWSGGWTGLQDSDWLGLRDFLRYHRLHLPFYINDTELNELKLVKRDGSVKVTPRMTNLKDIQTVFLEAA